MEVPPPEILDLPFGATRVEWRRSTRARRISLRIDPSGGAVVVTLPTRASRAAGLTLLKTHVDWVADRLAALPRQLPFADGARIPIGGMPHTIRHVPQARGGAWLKEGELHVTGDAAFLPRRVTDFLRAEARRRLTALVADKSAVVGIAPRRLTVKDTSSRWGSCAPDRSLAFSWRLVMAPDFVQDYVAAHEVAHLRHMNHGPHFWALVEELTPHRRAAIRWLRSEGAQLLRIG
ncbi:MAG: M48 family metallopeptidase [Acetobacteraceae bacterium]